LWQLFKDLDKARNTLVHSGVAVDTTGTVVSADRALELIDGAQRIVDWIEALLPVDRRMRRHQGNYVISTTRMLT
jgi:hypothetical protein